MNDEGSSLDDLSNRFAILQQEFKAKNGQLKIKKSENDQFESKCRSLTSTVDSSNVAIVNNLNGLQIQLETEIATNSARENTLLEVANRLEDANDAHSKGTQIVTEIERLEKLKNRKLEEKLKQEAALRELQSIKDRKKMEADLQVNETEKVKQQIQQNSSISLTDSDEDGQRDY